MNPIDVRRDDEAITWTWEDGSETRWTDQQLRSACPCATCREKKRAESKTTPTPAGKSMGLPMLSIAEARPTRVTELNPAGNYAYNIRFSDGHHSGLYTLQVLHEGPPRKGS